MKTLWAVLTWMVTEGGAGVVAWWLIDVLERREWRAGWLKRLGAWVRGLDEEAKRWFAIGACGATALAGWGVQMLFFYASTPVSWRDGVEQAVQVLALALPFAFLTSQIAHARAERVRALRAG